MTNENFQHEAAFNNALALYAVLRGSQTIRAKRAEMKSGEVEAIPIDFCADIEVRARETYGTREEQYLWGLVLQDPDNYVDLPPMMKWDLGRLIEKCNLGIGGHYKRLYYRIKNAVDRKKIVADIPEEDYDGGNESISGFGVAY